MIGRHSNSKDINANGTSIKPGSFLSCNFHMFDESLQSNVSVAVKSSYDLCTRACVFYCASPATLAPALSDLSFVQL